MALTKKEQKETFGMTVEDLLQEKPKDDSAGEYAIAILSDVQARLDLSRSAENRELVRQWINKAKFWVDYAETGVAAILHLAGRGPLRFAPDQ